MSRAITAAFLRRDGTATLSQMRGRRPQVKAEPCSTNLDYSSAERGPALSILLIILIVIVVLVLLGFFGRGRMR